MSIVSDTLAKLIKLQALDAEAARLACALEGIPARKKSVEDALAASKREFDEKQNLARRLQLDLKNKNAELEAAEAAVQKHTAELNTVKSNQAYRALLDEIEEAKRRSSEIEDAILKILDSADRENKAALAASAVIKKMEADAASELSGIDEETRKIESESSGLRAQREAAAAEVDPRFLSIYTHMLSAKGGMAIAKLEGSGCGGCHMKLSVQNINELERVYSAGSQSVELVRCENCSRILYSEKYSKRS
ncbi:MAG: hypothetical protein CVU77_07850 [Elusimicrobia bacterium HGW-Elusimicrobia-1]|jgi:hypothetical protein|nr:MAG: hypothetical protein CVU77_07850 [Elusimicrobia bacterium HGW-Elusimicrobia-1]